MNIELNYPPMPEGAQLSFVKPSNTFKQSVAKVAISMSLFIFIYLVILVAALGLVFVVGIGAIALVSAVHNFWVVVLSLGMVLSAVMLCYFLIKFIFKRNVVDNSDKFEITEDEQPRVFQFIRELTHETECPFPKRIFLTADVNAAVSYESSSFWNIFFPARKNLQIGLGLVNAVNLSEFKAVMAHEFGHFSQRSMKLGIYSYNMHRVIYNMLYENDGYDNVLRSVGQIHGILSIPVYVNVFLVRQVRKLMLFIYSIVNKDYMRLSREMEFHADSMSACVAGANHSINCLRRLEFAHVCYNELFTFLNKLAEDKKRPENLYPHHFSAMKFFGQTQQLTLDELGIPVINKKLLALNNTQINVEDQWASHPSMVDREEQLKQISFTAPATNVSAWSLFNDAEKLQVTLTNIIYAYSPERYDLADEETVKNEYIKYNTENSLNSVYKGFYNGRLITKFDVYETAKQEWHTAGFDDIFSTKNCNTPGKINGLHTDIGVLDYIINGKEVKSFDYNGSRYDKVSAAEIKTKLEAELKQAEEYLETLDKKAFQFFYHQSGEPEKLKAAYNALFQLQEEATTDLKLHQEFSATVNPVYTTMKFADIERTVDNIYEKENQLKPRLQTLLANPDNTPYITAEQKKHLEMYLSKKWVYFNNPEYDEPALLVLSQAANAYVNIVANRLFGEKKHLTDMQLKK